MYFYQPFCLNTMKTNLIVNFFIVNETKSWTSRKSFACSPTALQATIRLPINILTLSFMQLGRELCGVSNLDRSDGFTLDCPLSGCTPTVVRWVRIEVHSTSNGPSIITSTTRLLWHINSQAAKACVQREFHRIVPQLFQGILPQFLWWHPFDVAISQHVVSNWTFKAHPSITTKHHLNSN